MLPSDAIEIKPLAGLLQRPQLVPITPRDQQEAAAVPQKLAALQQAAAEDAHGICAPTHLMMKGGQIIGYLSLGGMPAVHAWFDSKHPHAADSLKMIELGEAILNDKGVRQYTIACAETSPFSAHMERMGFRKLGATVLWVKELTR